MKFSVFLKEIMLERIPTDINGAIKFELSEKSTELKLLDAKMELSPISRFFTAKIETLLQTETSEIVLYIFKIVQNFFM